MASTSETGHFKNLALFEDLITYCQAYGMDYHPTHESLKLPQLQAMYTAAQTTLNVLKTKKTSFDNATNARRDVYEDIKPTCTRIINALEASGASRLTIDDARGVVKKVQGVSTRKNSTDMTAKDPSAPRTISTSQQSYDRIKDHLANLIQILEQTPTYTPNEIDLQVPQLKAKLTSLESSKTHWIAARTEYSHAMIARNKVLYHPHTGLVAVSLKVKLYIKSIFGSRSPQYRQVSNIKFKSTSIV